MVVYIDDISSIESGSILSVACSDEAGNKFDLCLDMVYMGIDWEGEFEDELYKDIQKAYDDCISDNGKIDVDYIKRLVENHYYGMI